MYQQNYHFMAPNDQIDLFPVDGQPYPGQGHSDNTMWV